MHTRNTPQYASTDHCDYRWSADSRDTYFKPEAREDRKRLPIILMHSWPYSFIEMTRFVPLVTDDSSDIQLYIINSFVTRIRIR